MTDTITPWWEHAARAFEPEATRQLHWDTPGELAQEFYPLVQTADGTDGTVQTPALELIDEALVALADTPAGRLIITVGPQEGKSSRVARDFPLWALHRNPDTRIITASYGQRLAARNGRLIRNEVQRHPDRLGISIAPDNGSASEWQIDGHRGGVYSVGIGGAITGRACDLLIIDDPVKSQAEADSPVYRERVWDWWTTEAATRLSPTAPAVLILTRWHHDDLAGRLLSEPGSRWELLNIPAQCEDPSTDPLDRQVGEYMISARGRTPAQWEQRKKEVGSRAWASMYQGRPTPDEGNLFPAEAWARYTRPMWIVRDDGTRWVPEADRGDIELIQSWDFTFKDSDSSDYVVGQVWARRGPNVHLLDMVRKRAGFAESVQMVLDLTARWPQAHRKLIEDKANGPAIIDSLRQHIGGIHPVNPGRASKYSRAAAITPWTEAGNVVLPDPIAVDGTSWVTDLTDEAAEFPAGAHDDTVDAMSQAVDYLLAVQVLDDTIHTEQTADVDTLTQWETNPYDW